MRIKIAIRTALGALPFALLAVPTYAELLVGLTTSNQLVTFNSANPGVIQSTSPVISNLVAGDTIVDIDFYPVTRGLYGSGSSGRLYRLNNLTGLAVQDAAPQLSMGVVENVDFNPAADRLRVFSANDANFRITPSRNTAGPTGAGAGAVSVDGTFSYGVGGPNPNLVANAYTNNFDGTATTTLYSIDADLDALVIHSGAPQFSTIAQVGPLGVDVGLLTGFDISASGATFVSSGNALFNVNLATGQLNPAGAIGGPLSVATIAAAAVPEPTTGLLFVAAGLFATAMRTRRA